MISSSVRRTKKFEAPFEIALDAILRLNLIRPADFFFDLNIEPSPT